MKKKNPSHNNVISGKPVLENITLAGFWEGIPLCEGGLALAQGA